METTHTPTTAVTVGAFTIDSAGVLSGPAAYVNSDAYRSCMARIMAGTNVVFNFGSVRIGLAGFAASLEAALLVAVQTDYAAWRGLQTLGLGGRS
jgi:hypothetical protein